MSSISVPRSLFGSTYSDEELLTALYLENARLRSLIPEPAAQPKRIPLDASQVDRESRYEHVRSYLKDTKRNSLRPRLLVIANEYPNYGQEYGNGFVHRRVRAYQQSGAEVDVVSYGKRRRRGIYEYDGVSVLSGYVAELEGLLAKRSYDSISVHFLNPEMWTVLEPNIELYETPLTVFIHGYEADRWIRRVFDINSSDRLRSVIDRTFMLQRFWKSVVESRSSPSRFVFVSKYWQEVVQEDMDVHFPPSKVAIVHNVIDTELFRYIPKGSDQRFRFLWVRSATSRKYGADMAVKVLKEVLASRHGHEIEATIIGDGEHFSEFENAFGSDDRVRIERRFATQEEIADLHRSHGLFLVPTRLDSQGVSRDEAMSSGLVPITNATTAVPEFVDPSCGILAPHESVQEMVDGVLRIMDSPEAFLEMSRAAAHRARTQVGPEATIGRELEILGVKEVMS